MSRATCIGAWIRDSMAGIGTVTYYDPDSGAFGALGHGITDVDTAAADALLLRLHPALHGEGGEKGHRQAAPASCGAILTLRSDLGDLYANTDSGIFGTLSPCELTEQMGRGAACGGAG
ncbi:MAG: SpoIVB peptidase S55 domain-containing protein [Dysosmobacter sp.]